MNKVELSPWQNPEDGFPVDEYFDAVIVELEKVGVGIHESWRTERHEFVVEVDRSAFRDGPEGWAHSLFIGWCVEEESDPLCQDDDVTWHGFAPVERGIAGWHWLPRSENGDMVFVRNLDDPNRPQGDTMLGALADPALVAAAVAALVKPTEQEN